MCCKLIFLYLFWIWRFLFDQNFCADAAAKSFEIGVTQTRACKFDALFPRGFPKVSSTFGGVSNGVSSQDNECRDYQTAVVQISRKENVTLLEKFS